MTKYAYILMKRSEQSGTVNPMAVFGTKEKAFAYIQKLANDFSYEENVDFVEVYPGSCSVFYSSRNRDDFYIAMCPKN